MHIVTKSYDDRGMLEYERTDYYCSKCGKGVDSPKELKEYVRYELANPIPFGFDGYTIFPHRNIMPVSGVCCMECIDKMKSASLSHQ